MIELKQLHNSFKISYSPLLLINVVTWTADDCIYIKSMYVIFKYSTFGIDSAFLCFIQKAAVLIFIQKWFMWLPSTWRQAPYQREKVLLLKNFFLELFSPFPSPFHGQELFQGFRIFSILPSLKWLTKINNVRYCSESKRNKMKWPKKKR